MTTFPEFVRLNTGWNASGNVPLPDVSIEGSSVALRVLMTAPRGAGEESEAAKLIFIGCRKWRLGDPNDEGWYRGQCRYGKQAREWGHFYEIVGNDPLRDQQDDWQSIAFPGKGERHYLFYLRDETFECVAESWTLVPIRARAKVSSIENGLVGISGIEYLG